MHRRAHTGKNFLSLRQLSAAQLRRLLRVASTLRRKECRSLAGKSVVLLFDKPSLRTKLSFDIAVQDLGGHAIFMGRDEVGLGVRESVADVARVVSRFADAIVIRTFAQDVLEAFAENATVPVVNALTDEEHPCQALADLLTIQDHFGRISGLHVAYVGDGNNVARSLAQGALLLGAHVSIASPKGYELPRADVEWLRGVARKSGGSFRQTDSPQNAVRGADVVYTDVWTSMGQEKEMKKRLRDFRGFQVDMNLMALAKPGAIFMHDLPAHRGEEVTDAVLDGSQSVVFDQAENRLHAQRALLHLVLGSR